jgi:hypothetical protein
MHSLVAVVVALICSSISVAADTPAAADGHLRQLRFSPDGQYVLAQDDKTVTVLTARPLAVAFRIPAEDATLADFSPDSRQILFVTSRTNADSQHPAIRSSSARVERWGLADHARAGFKEIILPACGTERLSPDGSFLACDDLSGTFRLFEVSSGATLIENKHFGHAVLTYESVSSHPRVRLPDVVYDGKLGSALIVFSPGGRFLVAVPERAGDVEGLGWDLRQKRRVSLKGALRRLRWSADLAPYFSAPPFTFVAPDRAVISWPQAWNPKKDPTVTATLALFPSGKALLKPKIPPGPLFRAADPGFVIVRPCAPYAAAAVEYTTGRMITSETPALDVLGKYYVTELPNGEVGLYERGKGLQASVSLKAH